MADTKPTFSPMLVTAIITVFWLVVFGLVVHHGEQGIHEHDHVVASPAAAK